jgi:hypothetical protein
MKKSKRGYLESPNAIVEFGEVRRNSLVSPCILHRQHQVLLFLECLSTVLGTFFSSRVCTRPEMYVAGLEYL